MILPDERPEEEPDESFLHLNQECWRLLRDVVYDGTVRLRGGIVVSLKPEALFDVIMRLAQMKPPKTRKTPTVVDFEVQETYRGEKKAPPSAD